MKPLSPEEQQAKINEVKKIMGPIVDKFPVLCSDSAISRYLRARNWNTKKASKMLKDTLKWRLECKPEKIRWEDIAQEAETGKVYRPNYSDRFGRPVLIMRPGYQNSCSTEGQIKYLLYCMENAELDLGPGIEQMLWLIDFQGWTMSSISVKVTRETAHVLQDHYPERLGLALLYNPPKIFESFWAMVKPFLEPKTYKKVKFVYSNDPQSQRVIEALFDMDKLDSAFGGKGTVGFSYEAYRQRMKENDEKRFSYSNSGCSSPSYQQSAATQSQLSESSDHSDEANLSCGEETSANSGRVDEEKEVPTLSCGDVPKTEATASKATQ